MNKFYMNGKLIHKASDHNTKRCEVEKWVFLPHSDFERLKANPYQEHEAITAARDLMYEDKNAYHCIMLLDEYGEDGLLIEAEGFDYPRLSMFVPDAKSIYERHQTSESELKLHDMIKDTVEKIAELAHTDKNDFTSADMIDMDEVERLIKNAIVQQLAQRDDIKMAENTDIGVDFQPDIHVEAEMLTELKFYCPLKVQREIKPSFDEDEDEFFEDTEELSDFEVLEYESEISSAIEAYQCDEEENRGIMAYLGDRKRFADIFQKAGLKELTQACSAYKTPLNDGDAVITPAFNMTNAKNIIHAVGPDFSYTPTAFKELFDAYYNSLCVLKENGLHSISFPLISSGIFGGDLTDPAGESTKQCCRAYNKFIADYPDYEIEVKLCAFTSREMASAQNIFSKYIK